MDLHSALRISGRRWQLVRVGAAVCFLLACGLLVASLADSARAHADWPAFSQPANSPLS